MMNSITWKEMNALKAPQWRDVCRKIRLPDGFVFDSFKNGRLPRFIHQPSGLGARMVFRDAFQMGMSRKEYLAANRAVEGFELTEADLAALQPVRETEVGPFLVSELPVLPSQFDLLTGTVYGDVGSRDSPVRISLADAMEFCARLDARLPTSAEWEYVCRADTETLFYWGNELLHFMMMPWLICFDPTGTHASIPNPFGLKLLFYGEWTSTPAHTSNDPASPAIPGKQVARGGAASLWPWQTNFDWVTCIPAIRNIVPTECPTEHERFTSQYEQCVRPVWNLPM